MFFFRVRAGRLTYAPPFNFPLNVAGLSTIWKKKGTELKRKCGGERSGYLDIFFSTLPLYAPVSIREVEGAEVGTPLGKGRQHLAQCLKPQGSCVIPECRLPAWYAVLGAKEIS